MPSALRVALDHVPQQSRGWWGGPWGRRRGTRKVPSLETCIPPMLMAHGPGPAKQAHGPLQGGRGLLGIFLEMVGKTWEEMFERRSRSNPKSLKTETNRNAFNPCTISYPLNPPESVHDCITLLLPATRRGFDGPTGAWGAHPRRNHRAGDPRHHCRRPRAAWRTRRPPPPPRRAASCGMALRGTDAGAGCDPIGRGTRTEDPDPTQAKKTAEVQTCQDRLKTPRGMSRRRSYSRTALDACFVAPNAMTNEKELLPWGHDARKEYLWRGSENRDPIFM